MLTDSKENKYIKYMRSIEAYWKQYKFITELK